MGDGLPWGGPHQIFPEETTSRWMRQQPLPLQLRSMKPQWLLHPYKRETSPSALEDSVFEEEEEVCAVPHDMDKTSNNSPYLPHPLRNPRAPADYNVCRDFFQKLKPKYRDQAFVLDEADKLKHHLTPEHLFDPEGYVKEFDSNVLRMLEQPVPGSKIRRGLLYDPESLAKVLTEPLQFPPPPQEVETPWPVPLSPESEREEEHLEAEEAPQLFQVSPIHSPSPSHEDDCFIFRMEMSAKREEDSTQGLETLAGPTRRPPAPLEEYNTSGYRFREGDSSSVELEYRTPPREDSPPLSPRPVQGPPFPQGPQETYDMYVARSLES